MKKSKIRESRKAAQAAAEAAVEAAAQAAAEVGPTAGPALDETAPGTAPETAATIDDERATAPATSRRLNQPDLEGRTAVAEAMLAAATERAEIAEAMYRAALVRAESAAAVEKATAERASAIEARERAAAERDSIANTRDRTAAERDSIANTRDRAATERDAVAGPRLEAGHAGAAADGKDPELERARLEAELQRAHLDALTGAFRREMGRLALRNEIERARRGDGKFVIAFIDVDGLKGVNDQQGHAAGDRVLRTLAATMRANLRSYDPIVRFGGDEFILGVASVDPVEVQHRIGVMDTSLRNATGVGITAGLATLMSNETLDELTARADAALIEAKRGRSA